MSSNTNTDNISAETFKFLLSEKVTFSEIFPFFCHIMGISFVPLVCILFPSKVIVAYRYN